MDPRLNGTNATSYLLGNSLKMLKAKNSKGRWFCRAVITLANADRHVGSIYQVCNFKYYGLTAPKKDFYAILEDRLYKNPRGQTKDVVGVWLDRPRKHRYAFIFDPSLKCNYLEEERPKAGDVGKTPCCNGTHVVADRRIGKKYTCPICAGELKEIKE